MWHTISYDHTITIGTAKVTNTIEFKVRIDLDLSEDNDRGWQVSDIEVQGDDWKWHAVPATDPFAALVLAAVEARADDIDCALPETLDEDEHRAFRQFREAA